MTRKSVLVILIFVGMLSTSLRAQENANEFGYSVPKGFTAASGQIETDTQMERGSRQRESKIKQYKTPTELSLWGEYEFDYPSDLEIVQDYVYALDIDYDLMSPHVTVLQYNGSASRSTVEINMPLSTETLGSCQQYAVCSTIDGIAIGTQSKDPEFLRAYNRVVSTFRRTAQKHPQSIALYKSPRILNAAYLNFAFLYQSPLVLAADGIYPEVPSLNGSITDSGPHGVLLQNPDITGPNQIMVNVPQVFIEQGWCITHFTCESSNGLAIGVSKGAGPKMMNLFNSLVSSFQALDPNEAPLSYLPPDDDGNRQAP